jgi:metallo-beta-lactamase family protein
VTGANYILDLGGKKLMVDCGMFQGCHDCEGRNFNDFLFNVGEVQALVVTHAHIDHTGRIPKLVKNGFRGKIFSTAPTKEFAELLLRDSMHIIEQERRSRNKDVLFSEEDLQQAMSQWEALDYGEVKEFGDGVKMRLLNAGHILGSSMVEITYREGEREKVIVFTGDLGNPSSVFVPPPDTVAKADVLVIEAAYGGRLHIDVEPRQLLLERAVEDVVARKGVLMVPAFAMERTQELIYELNELVEHKRVQALPVFVDSPLANKITGVFKKYSELYRNLQHDKGDDVFAFPGLKFTESVDDSKAINDVPLPKVIIAGSGMSNAGRILHHERRYLSDPNSILLIVGYQIAGSLGRRIRDGEKKVKIFEEMVDVKCEVREIHGYSAHADQKQLFEFVSALEKPVEKVFAVQGEESAALSLVQLVRDHLGIDAKAPMWQDVYGI